MDLFTRRRAVREDVRRGRGLQGCASGEGLVGIGRSFGDGTGWSAGYRSTGGGVPAGAQGRGGSSGLRGCRLLEHRRHRPASCCHLLERGGGGSRSDGDGRGGCGRRTTDSRALCRRQFRRWDGTERRCSCVVENGALAAACCRRLERGAGDSRSNRW